MNVIKDLWNNSNDWMKRLIVILIGGVAVALIRWLAALLCQLLGRKTPVGKGFPFERVKLAKFGQWLLDNLRLTCYENPFVPKETEVIYTSGNPRSHRRIIFLGAAEIGKTRAAYEWVREILQDAPNAEILIPTGAGLPNPIREKDIPALAKTIVLFYDDLHTFLLPTGRTRRESEERVLSPEGRFEDLIELLEKRCTHLYIVATARWERGEAVRAMERYQGIWQTFDILTLKDAPLEREAEMIMKLAEHHGVELADGVAEQLANINKGRSYENTVLFLQNWGKREGRPLSDRDLEVYAQTTSARWEQEVFDELRQQDKLVAQLIGAMYTLRFYLELPLYERFVLRAAAIKTDGHFRKKHRLSRALRLLCDRGVFHKMHGIFWCYNFQLEISARISPSAQDCLNRLYRSRYTLSAMERHALAKWYFYHDMELYELGNFKDAAIACEKSVSMHKSYEAYNNWGVMLYELACLKKDERLFKQSIGKYEQAVKIEQDSHEIYYNLGVALANLARLKEDEDLFEQSIEKYKQAVDIERDSHETYYNWGNVLYELACLKEDEDTFERSIEKYEQAVKIKQYYHEAYYNWGIALH